MNNISKELNVIQMTLNEITNLNDDPSLLEVTENLLDRSRKICLLLNIPVHTIAFSNYIKTSHTLLFKEEAIEPQLSRLEDALSDLRSQRLTSWKFDIDGESNFGTGL